METHEIEYLLGTRVKDYVDGHWGDRVESGNGTDDMPDNARSQFGIEPAKVVDEYPAY